MKLITFIFGTGKVNLHINESKLVVVVGGITTATDLIQVVVLA